MEATLVNQVPRGPNWQYEPKWDGFRCLAFCDGKEIYLQSKSGQPLARYFPDVVQALSALKAKSFVLDGEIVVPIDREFSFDDLLMRIHPAPSRVLKLAQETPALFIAFDLMQDEARRSLLEAPLSHRRTRLEAFAKKHFAKAGRIRISPATRSDAQARRWFEAAGGGMDGIMAKDLAKPYCAGDRSCMQKVKRVRTADCVVGGFRFASKGRALGSLLLGLYDKKGLLHHVGFTSSFSKQQRKDLLEEIAPLQRPASKSGFTGRAPGGPSRWSTERTGEWEPLVPKLVVEVQWDHFSGDRFRHGTKFLRWRPDKKPRQCTMDQVKSGSVSPTRILKWRER